MTQDLDFMSAGGSTGALMRSLDWSTSPLRHPAEWPQSLRTVVGLLLQSQFPMFIAWGPDLGFLYNDPYAEILGAKHPQALGRRFYDIWSEIWTDISPLIDAAMAGRSIYREDLPLIMNRKGYDEQTWFTFSYSPVRDESGQVAGMFCAVSETTPKILAEQALRTSEHRLQALVRASSHTIFRMNRDWTQMLELDSRGFIADIKQPSDKWLGQYVHPSDEAMVSEAIQASIDSRSLFELEHRVRRVDGTFGWTLSRAVPITDGQGDIIEWFGTASDITSRMQAEDALRESESRLRSLFEAIDEGVMVIERAPHRADGLRDWRYVAMNRTASSMFGKQDMTGQSVRDNFPDEDEGWYDIYDSVAASGSGRRFERESVAQGMVLEMFVTRIGDSMPLRLMVVMQNVTERRRATDALKRREARHAFLLTLADELRPIGDPVAIMAMASEKLGGFLRVGRCGYGEVDASGTYFTVKRDWTNGVMASLRGTVRLDDFGAELITAYRSGRAVILDDALSDYRTRHAEAAFAAAGKLRASLAVPLMKNGRFMAAFYVQQTESRTWMPDDEALVREVAERTWAAVERARAEADLRISEERYRAVVEGARDYAIFLTDRSGRIADWWTGAETVYGWQHDEIVGKPTATLFTPEDIESKEPERDLDVALRDGSAIDARWHVRKDGHRVFIEGKVVPLSASGVSTGEFLVIGQNVTERRQAEETQRLLMGELNHRVKNTLAIIQSIAKMTLRHASGPNEFAEAFTGRLHSLARVHSILTDTSWRGADVRTLIRDQLSSGLTDEGQLDANGPATQLSPQVALHLALVLHELGTNATKFGALSVVGGVVIVRWSVVDGKLRLQWREVGGPRVKAPTRPGFGSLLIERTVKGDGGHAHVTFDSGGVTWELEIPLPQLPISVFAIPHGQIGARLHSPDDGASPLAGMRLIIIEDEPLVAMDCATVLEDAGAVVEATAGNIKEALELVESVECDGAVLDANLHGHPVDAIAAALTRRGVPFVFVTGYGTAMLPTAFARTPIVNKPYSPDKLISALGRVRQSPATISEIRHKSS